MPVKCLTDRERLELSRMFTRGKLTFTDIGKELSISRKTVKRVLIEEGLLEPDPERVRQEMLNVVKQYGIKDTDALIERLQRPEVTDQHLGLYLTQMPKDQFGPLIQTVLTMRADSTIVNSKGLHASH